MHYLLWSVQPVQGNGDRNLDLMRLQNCLSEVKRLSLIAYINTFYKTNISVPQIDVKCIEIELFETNSKPDVFVPKSVKLLE